MRTLFAAIGFCFLVHPLVLCGQVKGTCERAFEANFRGGGKLQMDLRSADIEVTGADAAVVRVSCEMKNSARAKEVAITFNGAGSFGDLGIHGGPNNDIHYRIEVPKNLSLFIRVPAGDLRVSGVVGDKDIEMHAGDLTISVGDPTEYRHADASVYAGDLNAGAFGVTKGGLFRSFNRDNPTGKYHLHAHVGAGDLILK
jgi:hypothetical protein